MILSKSEAIRTMDKLGAAAVPFLFFTDFKGNKAWVKPLNAIKPGEVSFAFNQREMTPSETPKFTFRKEPLSLADFKAGFDQVLHEIRIGNSFLVNLTFKTPVETNLSLSEIFNLSRAKYKLRYKDEFVVFSPETFVKMEAGYIYAYPMKGTIDASLADAADQILHDPKETAEHVTIVDLIRNDLSQVADRVAVTRFRFISEINTHEKTLLQVSSEIRGQLPHGYLNRLGSILFALLPAGSISGAPKPKTVEIIEQAETHERGFYTGICGFFDGVTVDTGVMIRFVEKENGRLYYKSGGGITSFSSAEKEYQEIIDKIYVPVY